MQIRGGECWDEIWPIIGPQIDLVMRSEGSTWHEEQLVPVTRHGGLQQVWWTYGYSPIDDEGRVGGVLVVCNDVTEHHLAKDALALKNEQLLGDVSRMRDLFGQAPVSSPSCADLGTCSSSPMRLTTVSLVGSTPSVGA